MENKKLIKILLKDMGELEELIAEIKANRHFDALETEFIHTRAKGILQLMQMLDSKEKTAQAEFRKEREILEKEPKKSESTESFKETIKEKQPDEEDASKESEKIKPQQEDTGQKAPEPKTVMTSAPGITAREKQETFTSENVQKSEDDVVLEEENKAIEPASRLGDSFLKGKSLNDLITDQNKLEFKLSNRPVTNIQTAIGINDRFQYIRELFDGDNQKFMDAVKTLDSKQNIKEAVDYLRNNFKWKKNETSLKFVNLVKRRFLNE